MNTGKPIGLFNRATKICLLVLAMAWSAVAAPDGPDATPAKPREFYNDGTKKLRAGKLSEAETSLQAAVAGQNEKIQPAALYNLGEVRFNQGAQELKKAPGGDSMRAKTGYAQKTA